MKKIFILLFIFLVGVVGCTSKTTNKIIKQEYISIAQLKEKIDKKETFMFVVSSRQCSHCNKLTAYLDKYESAGTIYKFEASTATQVDIRELTTMFPELNSTPTTFVFENGAKKDTIVGFEESVMKNALTSFFNK